MRPFAVVAALAALAASPACRTFATNRAALVPHATPLPGDGQSLSAPVEVQLGAINATDVRAPGSGDPDAAVEIPDTQLHGALGVRLGEYVSFGVLYERGLASTARPIKSTQPPVDHGDVSGYGYTLALSLPMDDHFRIGVSAEVMLWMVPWVEYAVCVDCASPYQTMRTATDGILTGAIAMTPSYRVGRWTYFGGATLANHPTLAQKAIVGPGEGGNPVSSGPGNFTVDAGAEVELAGRVRASLVIAQTLTEDPVVYGPSLGVMITIPLGTLPPAPPAPSVTAAR